MTNPVPQSTDDITDLFAAGSPLADCLRDFAPRAGQAQMATAVAAAIAQGTNLVVEAGTGTGKTLAYAVPALLSGKRVILSTGTRNLQDQLFYRDLPALGGALGRPARTVLLKGRANYLCLQRLATAVADPGAHASELRQLQQWSRVTRVGDRSEVEHIAEDADVWPRVTSTVDNCLGAQCGHYSECHIVAARQAAQKADIVVVNHHLLLADLVLKDEGFGELLPGCEAVIVDEAHQFPDIAQGFFNTTLHSHGLFDLAHDIRQEALVNLPRDCGVDLLTDGLIKAVRELRLVLPADGANLMWEEAAPGLTAALAELTVQLDAAIDFLDACDPALAALRRCRERAVAAVEQIEQLGRADESSGFRWIGLSRLGFSLNYTPVDIAESLQALLARQECAWILTSATLTVAGDFQHFLQRLGFTDVETLAIDSPFDYASQGCLYLPGGLPDPAAAEYNVRMLEEVLPLVAASQGRAFLLFTSHRALREAATWLRAKADFPYPLLVQGEAPRPKLLEQFAALPDPVLLGTASFWEGVDMRGDSLVLVVIDRLPFASPGDPLLRARLEAIRQRGGNAFRDCQLPQAVLSLKQGVGRLIRDFSDTGVVVLCDPRLTNRGYGRQFLRSLPPFAVVRDRTVAEDFLRRAGGEAL